MPEMSTIPAAILAAARESVAEAGRMALAHFRPGSQTSAQVHFKAGGSPVTDADLAVDRFLHSALLGLAPDFGWLSEETVDHPSRLQRSRVWVVDPIDGTRAFARGDTDWTVAVGIVEDGRPVAGFVFAPVREQFYEALPGAGASLNGRPISVTSRDVVSGATLAGPKPALETVAALHGAVTMAPKIHSLAYRIVRVAEGVLDGGLAGGASNDWDLAAAHAVLAGAGGELVGQSGEAPRYNRPSTVHEPLVAAGPGLSGQLVAALRADPGRPPRRRT
jgi:myo-inositol-1(or 4)-monophosphatase